MLSIAEMTFIISMMILPFTPSPLSVLIFFMFANTMLDVNRWAAFVIIMFVSQVVYIVRKNSEKNIG
jgi:hypothetical protein